MTNPKFEIFQRGANQFYFRLKATNGEIILASESYTTKQSCETGIASVKVNAPNDARYIRNQNGSSYTFNLTAANGEIIGRSESDTTAQSRENGTEAVKRGAPGAVRKVLRQA